VLNEPNQAEVDVVALAIATIMHACGILSPSADIAKWPGVQEYARAAIIALDYVRALESRFKRKTETGEETKG
jgi:hypothetical protein